MTASRLRARLVQFLYATLLLAILSLSGCGGGRAYDEGYLDGYEAGHEDGFGKGELRGARHGTAEGRSSASGSAWERPLSHVYLAPAFWSFLVGIGIGLIIQYLILFDAKDKGRVPSLVQTGLVPAMTSTFSYRLLERRWRLLARIDDWLKRVARQRNARVKEIEAVRAVVVAKINAASDLEDLVGRKYVALASKELNRIVSEAGNERRSPLSGSEGSGTAKGPRASD